MSGNSSELKKEDKEFVGKPSTVRKLGEDKVAFLRQGREFVHSSQATLPNKLPATKLAAFERKSEGSVRIPMPSSKRRVVKDSSIAVRDTHICEDEIPGKDGIKIESVLISNVTPLEVTVSSDLVVPESNAEDVSQSELSRRGSLSDLVLLRKSRRSSHDRLTIDANKQYSMTPVYDSLHCETLKSLALEDEGMVFDAIHTDFLCNLSIEDFPVEASAGYAQSVQSPCVVLVVGEEACPRDASGLAGEGGVGDESARLTATASPEIPSIDLGLSGPPLQFQSEIESSSANLPPAVEFRPFDSTAVDSHDKGQARIVELVEGFEDVDAIEVLQFTQVDTYRRIIACCTLQSIVSDDAFDSTLLSSRYSPQKGMGFDGTSNVFPGFLTSRSTLPLLGDKLEFVFIIESEIYLADAIQPRTRVLDLYYNLNSSQPVVQASSLEEVEALFSAQEMHTGFSLIHSFIYVVRPCSDWQGWEYEDGDSESFSVRRRLWVASLTRSSNFTKQIRLKLYSAIRENVRCIASKADMHSRIDSFFIPASVSVQHEQLILSPKTSSSSISLSLIYARDVQISYSDDCYWNYDFSVDFVIPKKAIGVSVLMDSCRKFEHRITPNGDVKVVVFLRAASASIRRLWVAVLRYVGCMLTPSLDYDRFRHEAMFQQRLMLSVTHFGCIVSNNLPSFMILKGSYLYILSNSFKLVKQIHLLDAGFDVDRKTLIVYSQIGGRTVLHIDIPEELSQWRQLLVAVIPPDRTASLLVEENSWIGDLCDELTSNKALAVSWNLRELCLWRAVRLQVNDNENGAQDMISPSPTTDSFSSSRKPSISQSASTTSIGSRRPSLGNSSSSSRLVSIGSPSVASPSVVHVSGSAPVSARLSSSMSARGLSSPGSGSGTPRKGKAATSKLPQLVESDSYSIASQSISLDSAADVVWSYEFKQVRLANWRHNSRATDVYVFLEFSYDSVVVNTRSVRLPADVTSCRWDWVGVERVNKFRFPNVDKVDLMSVSMFEGNHNERQSCLASTKFKVPRPKSSQLHAESAEVEVGVDLFDVASSSSPAPRLYVSFTIRPIEASLCSDIGSIGVDPSRAIDSRESQEQAESALRAALMAALVDSPATSRRNVTTTVEESRSNGCGCIVS